MRVINDRDEQSLRDLQGYATYCRSVAAKEFGERTETGALRECVNELTRAVHKATRPILLDTMPDGYETSAELTIEFDVYVHGEEVRYFLHGVEITDILYGMGKHKPAQDMLDQLNQTADDLTEEAEWHMEDGYEVAE